MSIYQYAHPFSSGMAIPKYILSEPQGRGTFTTRYEPRGTIGTVPQNRQVYNRTRWAAPDYTQGRYDKTAQVTKMLPRRTVGLLAPDFFARPKATYPVSAMEPNVGTVSTSLIGPKPGAVAMGSTLDGTTIGGVSTLGAHAAQRRKVKDPIAEYGKKVASVVMAGAMRYPRSARKAQLQIALDKVSPGFRADVEAKAKKYQEKGYKPKDALRRAMAASFSNKMLADFIHAGSGTSGNIFQGLGDLWDDIGNTVAGIHCAVATSDITKTAATVVGGVYGGPGGAAAAGAGANVLASPCGGGAKPPLPGSYPVQASSFPIIPIVAAAGALGILFLALK